MSTDWIDSRTGKPVVNENNKAPDKKIDELLRHYFKRFEAPSPKTLSLLEIVFCSIIASAIKKARERKIRNPDGQAAFIVGYLSSRMGIDQIDFKLRNRPEFLAQKIGCVVWCHAKKRPTWTLESMKQEILKCLKR